MKSLKIGVLILLLPFLLVGQEKPKAIEIVFGGFIRNDLMFNTRQISSARGESQFSLVPLPILYDFQNNDINANPNFNMAILNTRVNMKIYGPKAFGAKTYGFIEADFLGISTANKFAFRARHAYIHFEWEKAKLLSGMYWHPIFVTDCYPGTVSFNTGVPFNPLSRVPQIRFTYPFSSKASLFAAVMSQGHFVSVAPVGAAQNSGIPELHLQFQYKSDKLAAGAGVNYLTLKPSLTTIGVDAAGNPQTYTSDALAQGLSFIAYLKLTTKPLIVRAYGKYGQMDDHAVMMGGYAQVDIKNPTIQQVTEGYTEFVPFNVASAWIDFCTTGEKIRYGLFAGYSENFGANKEIVAGSFSGRWGNVKNMMRFSPRIVFISNKTDFGFEVEYSTASYAKSNPNGLTAEEITGINAKGKVINHELADNIKFQFTMNYNF